MPDANGQFKGQGWSARKAAGWARAFESDSAKSSGARANLSRMPLTSSPAINYLSRSNIVHPLSNLPGTQGDSAIAELEAAARVELAARVGSATVTGGTIKKGK